MNARSKIASAKGTVFKSNRSQAVRIPKEFAFPDDVKQVIVRRMGQSLVITPQDNFWVDFFNQPGCPDFPDRPPQGEYEVRESFDD